MIANVFPSRITSLHYFTAETGEVGILFTTGNELHIVQTDGTDHADITGSLALPNDVFWQWKTFAGLAFGCNKATSGDNPVKVNTSSVASALGGSPPKAKYIEVWDNRLWLVSATEPSQVWGSGTGDPEDWDTNPMTPTALTAVALDFDPDDGDIITGLFATRAALYVFKRKRIFKIIQITPTEDNLQGYKVEIHAQTIGCISPYSIYPVLDDVLFLSESGLASLTLAATTEDFRTALYSRNISEIGRMGKTTEEIPCYLFDTSAQYWISVPSNISTRQINEVYVMDYLRIDQQIVRWTRFDGLAAGTAFTSFIGPNGKVYVVGAMNSDGDFKLYRYEPKDTAGPFNDDGEPYTKALTTKAYNVDLPLVRKWWKKWGYGFNVLTNNAQVSIQYFFDEDITKGGDQSFTLNSGTGGAFWDQALWDVGEWDSSVRVPVDVVRRFLTNSSGQKSQNITFVVSNGQANEAVVIKHMTLWFSMLGERRVNDV